MKVNGQDLFKVLVQDGSVVFIRHGSRYVKAHVCRVQPTENYVVNGEETEPQQPISDSEISRRTIDIINDIDDEVDGEDDLTLVDSAGNNIGNDDTQEESQSGTGTLLKKELKLRPNMEYPLLIVKGDISQVKS